MYLIGGHHAPLAIGQRKCRIFSETALGPKNVSILEELAYIQKQTDTKENFPESVRNGTLPSA